MSSVLEITGQRVKIGDVGWEAIKVPGMDGDQHPLLKAKLIPREELSELGEFLKRRGVKKALTTGVFDMIHIGHARYLELARRLGGEFGALMVGLNSDLSVRSLKGPDRPILTEQRRAEMLSFLQFVTYITIYDEMNGAEIIRQFKPDAYLCVEGSWEGDLAAKAEVVAMHEHGGEVFFTPRQDPSLSTTAIIKAIEEQYGRTLMGQFRELVKGGGDEK